MLIIVLAVAWTVILGLGYVAARTTFRVTR